jgi:hypothetical protein
MGVLGACRGGSAAKPELHAPQARARLHQRLRGRRHSGACARWCPNAPKVRTGAGAAESAVPVGEGPSRRAADCGKHPPRPCSPDGLRQPESLWARARVPRARGSAATPRGGGVGVLGAGPEGRAAPGTGSASLGRAPSCQTLAPVSRNLSRFPVLRSRISQHSGESLQERLPTWKDSPEC